MLDPYNPIGSSSHINFNTARTNRWETDSRRCHVNWVILDSDWEAEFCRVAESHPKVISYVKNHNLGLEVPYRFGSNMRKYIPDFIVLVDDGHGVEDPLHLIVEIKGYRREDAKEKKAAMENYWVPGVNNNGQYGSWAFVEFTDVYKIESDFKATVEAEFSKLIARFSGEKGVSVAELNTALYASLVDYLELRGGIQSRPFEERPCTDAILKDIDANAVVDFVRLARFERQFPLSENAPLIDILTHLHLIRDGYPTNAALLLFGRAPQAFIPCAEVRCMHFCYYNN